MSGWQLAEIERRSKQHWSRAKHSDVQKAYDDRAFLLGILSRLGDEKVIEAAAREIDPIAWLDTPLTAEQDIARAGYRKQSLTDARAALSAGLAAAMMEE